MQMVVNSLYICTNLINRTNIVSLIQKCLPVISRIRMDSSRLTEINFLFNRLKEANKQAEKLRIEINNIREEIHQLSESQIFERQNISDIDDTNIVNNSNNSGPPAKKSKYDFKQCNDYVVVYTDGACENNGRIIAKAGIGVWFDDNHPLNVSMPVKGKATNNTAEIQACISAVKIANTHGIKKLKIITDSQFTINSMTKWIRNWKKNNWKLAGGKGEVKNKTDFQKLDSLCRLVDVKWEHVAGHKGIRGNEEADRLAREGAKFYKCTP